MSKNTELLLRELNDNIKANTDQSEKLETEIKITRETDEKNREFLEEVVKTLIANQQQQQNKTFGTLKTVIDWSLRVIFIVVLIGLGIKFGPDIIKAVYTLGFIQLP